MYRNFKYITSNVGAKILNTRYTTYKYKTPPPRDYLTFRNCN